MNFPSAAETKLLPVGKIIGIRTRWHLDDVHGRLLGRAQEDRSARQFSVRELGSVKQWRRLNTRTGKRKGLPPYRAFGFSPGPAPFFQPSAIARQASRSRLLALLRSLHAATAAGEIFQFGAINPGRGSQLMPVIRPLKPKTIAE